MREAIEKALMAMALADLGYEEWHPAESEIMDYVPEVPRFYSKRCAAAVETFVETITEGLGFDVSRDVLSEEDIVEEFMLQHVIDLRSGFEWPITPSMFGHYAVMTAHGEGVGLSCFVTYKSWQNSELRATLEDHLDSRWYYDVINVFQNAAHHAMKTLGEKTCVKR